MLEAQECKERSELLGKRFLTASSTFFLTFGRSNGCVLMLNLWLVYLSIWQSSLLALSVSVRLSHHRVCWSSCSVFGVAQRHWDVRILFQGKLSESPWMPSSAYVTCGLMAARKQTVKCFSSCPSSDTWALSVDEKVNIMAPCHQNKKAASQMKTTLFFTFCIEQYSESI